MARINRVGMRADKFKIVGIKNMKRGDGTYIMEGRGKLVKDVDHYTMECDECDHVEEAARIDEHGDIPCPDCGLLLNAPSERMMYPEDYSHNRGNGDGGASVGASGHPLLRVPALRDAGPSPNDAL